MFSDDDNRLDGNCHTRYCPSENTPKRKEKKNQSPIIYVGFLI
jgi:hypothetical protein